MFGMKKREEVERRRRLEELAARFEAGTRSSLGGTYWCGYDLVESSSARVVASLKTTGTESVLIPFSWVIVQSASKWATTDGNEYVSLDAAKRHEETLHG